MLHKLLEYNLNTSLEENFNRALNLCEQELSHQGLLELLSTGSVAEKQFAALSLDEIRNEKEAEVFIFNLTDCDGKIREAVASRLEEFLSGACGKFFLPYYKKFADATIDINANISRMVIDALIYFKQEHSFNKNYSKILLGFVEEAFEEIAKIKFRDKKYVLNKQLFKMYWALEGLLIEKDYVEKKYLHRIISRVLARPEYTIREKAALILVSFKDDDEFLDLLKLIENDENFYVRRVVRGL